MKNILFIHQSADLYGSDKTLLYLVESIKDVVNPIVVVPEKGPLTDELHKINIPVFIIPVIKVSRQLFTSLDFLKLPFQIFRALKALKNELGDTKIDLIHSNTIAVFLGALYSKKNKIKHIWHVHEIIKSPKVVAKAYPYLVNWFSDAVIFNSLASAEHLYQNKPKLKNKSKIIYNGLDRNYPFLPSEEKEILKKEIFKSINKSSKIIGLVGRINRHKGQKLLLNVFDEIVKTNTNIFLLFIGSTIKSQNYLLEDLKNEISSKNLKERVTIINFQKDIWKFYDCIDIVVVPTTDPEPFGLVALEGMLSKKPVVASNHGGLKEIVLHKKTGLLFEPNNKADLKISLETLLTKEPLIKQYGEAGEIRAKIEFSLEKYINNFKTLYNSF